MKHIIISDNTFNSGEPARIVHSNVTFVSLLLDEDVAEEQVHPDALTAYYLDYYDSQYRNGNFSQFVYNSGWNAELNAIIEKGLQQINAMQHLELFKAQSEKVDRLTADELTAFFDGDYFGEDATRDGLKNDHFFTLNRSEDIGGLNAIWLKQHPDLKVLSID